MTQQKMIETLRKKATEWARIGVKHPSFNDPQLVSVLLCAADKIEQLQDLRHQLSE